MKFAKWHSTCFLTCDAGYWAVDAKEETAMNGVWKKGPGKDLFEVLDKVLPARLLPSSALSSPPSELMTHSDCLAPLPKLSKICIR